MEKFIRKQPEASNDYTKAYKLVTTIETGDVKIVSVDNLKAFRKYIHDLGSKAGKSFTTKKQGGSSIKIVCLP